MAEGGRLERVSDKAVRLMTLLVAPAVIVHCLLVMNGILPGADYVNKEVSMVLCLLWLGIGLYHYVAPFRTGSDILTRLIVFEALGLATMMFVTGFFQPLLMVLVLLFLAAHAYFGYRGLSLSLVGVLAAMALDTVVRYRIDPGILPQNLIAGVSILIVVAILVAIFASQELRNRALTRSQRLERLQYDRLLTVINNLTDATFSTDSKGRVQLYNAACLSLLDTNASLKGKSIDDLFALTDSENQPVKLSDLLQSAERTTKRDDIRHTYGDGEQIRLELTFAPIKGSYSASKKQSEDRGYMIIASDITKEKSLEEERDEFISVVSHELRTPITIVEGTLSNLQILANRPETNVEVLKSSINTAHDQVLYLAKMVNDLSTLSRAERGVADTPETIDVTDMVHSLHQQYTTEAEAKGLHLNLDLGPKLGTITASRLYTEELLQNFITNAIKYTKEGSITIIVKRTKNVINFAVKDTGIGISRGDQAKIFQKFYRSEDYRIRETSGTGLGLYVSAKLAHKLGTKINLTSRLNHGSTFSFEMPADVK